MTGATVLLTVFGLGRSPVAPGTVGSLPPVAVAAAMALAGVAAPAVDATLVLLGLVFGVACVVLGTRAEKETGSEDPQWIVADEVAGQSLTLLLLPWRAPDEPSALGHNLLLAITGFVAFRLFDITKPWPANGLQRLHGGWGILVDDLVAGIYALIVMQLLARVALPWILA